MSEPSPWIKASASASGSQCVEMRRNGESVQVRDSKDPGGPVLSFTLDEFAAWLDGAKGNEFERLL